MRTTITHKGRAYTFSRPGDVFVFVDTNGKGGSLGEQCRARGRVLSGAAKCYVGDDVAEFRKLCQSWLRQHVRNLSKLEE